MVSAKAEKLLAVIQEKGGGVLEEFASRSVNMTRIISRPARTGLGVYIFFFDLEIEAGKSRVPLEESIEAVREKSIWLKDLGRFPVLEK